MVDFFMISTQMTKNGIEIKPKFKICKSKDLIIMDHNKVVPKAFTVFTAKDIKKEPQQDEKEGQRGKLSAKILRLIPRGGQPPNGRIITISGILHREQEV